MKPLIIGEQPSKTGDPTTPVQGRIGDRLADFMGLTHAEYMTTFERMNLLDIRAEYSGKGHKFNVRLARERAAVLRQEFQSGQRVLLLGKRVAEAFDLPTDYFMWHEVGRAVAFTVPHPSGVNRWWNDINNLRRMTSEMRLFMGCLSAPITEAR